MKPSERILQIASKEFRLDLDRLVTAPVLFARYALQYLDEEQERRAKWEAMVEGRMGKL